MAAPAKLTVTFREGFGEPVSDYYTDHERMLATIRFVIQGMTVETINIDLYPKSP